MIRKIRTKEEVEKEKKRNQWIIGIVMVGLLVVSTAGFSLLSSDQEGGGVVVEENGYNFISEGGYWSLQYGGSINRFYYLPSQTEEVELIGEYSLNDYVNKPLYFVGEVTSAGEVLQNIQGYVLRYQEACIEGLECEGDLPIKTCQDNLIIFEMGNETSVEKLENCVYIRGDLIKASDAFLYKLFSIS